MLTRTEREQGIEINLKLTDSKWSLGGGNTTLKVQLAQIMKGSVEGDCTLITNLRDWYNPSMSLEKVRGPLRAVAKQRGVVYSSKLTDKGLWIKHEGWIEDGASNSVLGKARAALHNMHVGSEVDIKIFENPSDDRCQYQIMRVAVSKVAMKKKQKFKTKIKDGYLHVRRVL